MARFCEVCGKGKISGNKISHADNKSRRTWSPNVRRVRIVENGTVRRANVCTRCLRSGRVERAL